MVGLFIIVALLAIGFAAGYVTRGVISRKRQNEYLNLHPYVSSKLGSRRSSGDNSTRTRRAPSEPATSEGPSPPSAKHDITRSFQEISIDGMRPAKPSRPVGANLHLVQPDRPEPDAVPLPSANVEESLEELVALLLQRRGQG